MKHSPAQTHCVALETHVEQGLIGKVEETIRVNGGEVIRSSSLTWRIWYVAETSCQKQIQAALKAALPKDR